MNKFVEKIKQVRIDMLFIITFIILILKFSVFLGFITYTSPGILQLFKGFFQIQSYPIFAIFLLGYLSISFLFKGRGRGFALIVLNLIMSIVIIGDLWYYRGLNSFLSFHLLKETTNLDDLQASIIALIHKEDIIFVIDILIITPIYLFFRKSHANSKRNIKLFICFALVSIFYIPVSIKVFHNYTYSYWVGSRWNPIYTMKRVSPIGYHVYDGIDFFGDLNPINLKADDKKEIKTWYKDNKENNPDNQYKGMFKGKNLIVIQTESLENFVINKSINGQEVTPNLNKLLKNSIYFSNYHENVNQGVSSDADLMTNASVYPVRRGSTFFRFPYNKYNSLPSIMKKYGYYTMAIHPDKAMYWNWMPALTSMGGFDKRIDASYFDEYEKINLGISDGAYLKQVEPIIVKEKKPFYDFVVTLTNHTPFILPSKYRELKLSKDFDSTEMGGYMQCIHYTDKQIGIFLDKLDKEGILKDTVVVIYGDHTGIHKYFQNEIPKMPGIQSWMVDDQMKIPLIVYDGSGTLKGEEKTITSGQIDLMPTLLYIMGVDKSYYVNTVMGRNILNTSKNYDLLNNGKVLGSPSKSDLEHLSQSFDVSDKMVQSEYYGVKSGK
ncbi:MULTISPECIES: LTA synthase family protein [Clostridium]|uniref:LTA synthase family protein n=1 Tax=Clostridium TaxID=1485 RepID=UPI0008242111|nr:MULTISPECIES: LTA synthase family protein [Clostridium]PJI07450.1 LTA synthase family protein [Clostridium sp. CT7]